jgi:hypothetical protein
VRSTASLFEDGDARPSALDIFRDKIHREAASATAAFSAPPGEVHIEKQIKRYQIRDKWVQMFPSLNKSSPPRNSTPSPHHRDSQGGVITNALEYPDNISLSGRRWKPTKAQEDLLLGVSPSAPDSSKDAENDIAPEVKSPKLVGLDDPNYWCTSSSLREPFVDDRVYNAYKPSSDILSSQMDMAVMNSHGVKDMQAPKLESKVEKQASPDTKKTISYAEPTPSKSSRSSGGQNLSPVLKADYRYSHQSSLDNQKSAYPTQTDKKKIITRNKINTREPDLTIRRRQILPESSASLTSNSDFERSVNPISIKLDTSEIIKLPPRDFINRSPQDSVFQLPRRRHRKISISQLARKPFESESSFSSTSAVSVGPSVSFLNFKFRHLEDSFNRSNCCFHCGRGA